MYGLVKRPKIKLFDSEQPSLYCTVHWQDFGQSRCRISDDYQWWANPKDDSIWDCDKLQIAMYGKIEYFLNTLGTRIACTLDSRCAQSERSTPVSTFNRIFCVAASSAPVERIFSCSGLLMAPQPPCTNVRYCPRTSCIAALLQSWYSDGQNSAIFRTYFDITFLYLCIFQLLTFEFTNTVEFLYPVFVALFWLFRCGFDLGLGLVTVDHYWLC